MNYLLIVVGVVQLLHFLCCYRMLVSIKRRHRNMDARIRNMTEWIITSHQAIMRQLNKMNEDRLV